MASHRVQKGVNNVHSLNFWYTQGVNKTLFFVTTQALHVVLGHQVWTFPKFPSAEIDWHGETVGQICSCSVLGLPGK